MIGIIGLILIGIFLLMIELVILPGLITGIAGFAMIVGGVWASYKWYGPATGTIVLCSTFAATLLMIILVLRSKAWKKMQLDDEVTGKANTIDEYNINAGDKGVTVSRLAPAGTARINEHLLEVHSDEGFVDENTSIVVHSVKGNKIIVRRYHG